MKLQDLIDTVYKIFNGSALGTNAIDVYSYIACEWVGPFVISISFIWFLTQIILSFYKKGAEAGKDALKHYAMRWGIILLLCVPVAEINGNPYNFLNVYPYLVLKTGIDFGNEVAGYLPIFDPSKYSSAIRFKTIPKDCSTYTTTTDLVDTFNLGDVLSPLKDVRASGATGLPQDNILAIIYSAEDMVDYVRSYTEKASEWIERCQKEKDPPPGGHWYQKIVIIAALAVILVLLWPVLASAATTLIMTGLKIIPLLWSTLQWLFWSGAPSAVLTASWALVGNLITHALMSTIFVILTNFAFLGAIVTWLAKGLIYCVTFPFAALNLPFERQKDNFVRLVVKGIALMFIPTVLVIIYDTTLVLFSLISANGGLIDTLAGAFSSAGSGISWLFMKLIWFIMSPFVIVLPLAKLLYTSQAVVEEIFQARAYYGIGQIGQKIAQL